MSAPSTLPLHLRPMTIALVFAGGFAGTAARYGVAHWLPTKPFSWATLSVNIVGALVLGALLEALLRAGADAGYRQRVRLLVGTGFCGGLTTYSTFMLDIRTSTAGTAILYCAVTIFGGVAAAVAGVAAARALR